MKNFFHFNFTGRCICQHNTEGDFCERCISGYYGNPKNGSEFDCKPCPCPDGGPCAQLHNGDVVCTDCKEGHGGKSYFSLTSIERLQFFWKAVKVLMVLLLSSCLNVKFWSEEL